MQCVQIKTGSWYEPVQDMRGQFAGIVSNPPYIPQSQMEHLQVSRPTVCGSEAVTFEMLLATLITSCSQVTMTEQSCLSFRMSYSQLLTANSQGLCV